MILYIGLVHYPVYNKNYDTIASAVTTLDIHDISRLARTYEAKAFFVITPLEDQKKLVERIKAHWTEGYGASYNPDRKEALEMVTIAESIEDVKEKIEKREGEPPICVATDAVGQVGKVIKFDEARDLMRRGKPILLFLGTAWGLHRRVLEDSEFVLEPIHGPTDYNHLSVRTAAAIILDRLVER